MTGLARDGRGVVGLVRRIVLAWLRMPLAIRAAMPVLVMGVLWWSSSRQMAPEPPSDVRAFLHNGMHVVAYAALCVAWSTSLRRGAGQAVSLRCKVAGVLLSVAYGVADEWHQSHVPGRVCSVSDVISDLSGALLAVVLLDAALGVGSAKRGVIAGCLFLCVASVAFATWGPW